MYNLLVVDDESIIRRGIRELVDFESLGIGGCFEAEDGEKALAVMKEHPIDLILADINMPVMSGLEFCRRAKELDAGVKIAILTGYDYLDYAIRAIKIGVDDYALKPLSKDDIQKLLSGLRKRNGKPTASPPYGRRWIIWRWKPVRTERAAFAARFRKHWKSICPIQVFPSVCWRRNWDTV